MTLQICATPEVQVVHAQRLLLHLTLFYLSFSCWLWQDALSLGCLF